MEFLDVKTDFAFKKVFGGEQSRDILLSFLNAIIYKDSPKKITDVTIVDPANIPMLKGMKDIFVNVKAVLNDGSYVIIEMQVLNYPGFEKHVLCNAAKNYSIQLKKGEDYTLLNPVIALTLSDFVLFEEREETISRFKLIEKESFIEYSDDIELIFVELPKFTMQENELSDVADKWLWFVKNAGTLDFIPQDFDAELKRAFEIINEANLSAPELEAQYKRKEFIAVQRLSLDAAEQKGMQQGIRQVIEQGIKQGIKQGIGQGIEQGIKQEKEQVAKKMLQQNITTDVIMQVTGLNRDQIEKL